MKFRIPLLWFLLLLSGFCLGSLSHAQNVIVNSGFEQFKKGGPVVAANSFASYQITGWYMPTSGTTDWYCNIEGNTNPIPEGFRSQYNGGKTAPHTGNSMGGFHAYFKSSSDANTEYAGGTFSTPLNTGHRYTFSFWIKLGPNSDMRVTRLGVKLSYEKIELPSVQGRVDSIPEIILKVDSFSNWTLVKAEFVANGGEKYFTIGNFSSSFENSASYIKTVHNKFWSYAYYYIDDVSCVDMNPSSVSQDSLIIKAGTKLVTQSIYFETGMSTIQPNSYSMLNQVVASMKNQPKLNVDISGHTDNVGNSLTNQKLSEDRADAVKEYLVSKGIASSRITTKGYGSTLPLGSDKDKNRRVEFYFHE